MKRTQYPTYISLLGISYFLLCMSCQKRPDKPAQPDSKSWLLHQIYIAEYDYYDYLAEEFIYQGMPRPSLDISYENDGDTARIDSLFYDNQERLVKVGCIYFSLNARNRYVVKRIHYNAAGRIDTVRIEEPAKPSPLIDLFTYSYNGNVVTQYIHNTSDSLLYIYGDGRNLAELRMFFAVQAERVVIDRYWQYDDCNNIYSYLNMNVYLPFPRSSFSRDVVNMPFISRNNYRLRNTSTYTYSLDSLRLITSAVVKSPNERFATTYRYKYIPAE